MLGILDRFEKQAVDQEQLLNMTEDELLQHHIQQQQPGGGSGADEGNAETKDPRRKLTPKERDELIQKAIEQEQLEENKGSLAEESMGQDDIATAAAEQEEMDRALEQEYQDFVGRFAGVDLDQESFDSIWAILSPEEQEEFRERFMISGKTDKDEIESTLQMNSAAQDNSTGDDGDDEEEEQEAKLLLKEMEDTMQRGEQGRRGGGGNDSSDAMLADLDVDDLKALRDAEISELIPIWKPWWEIEAEEAGQLKKVIVSEVATAEDTKVQSSNDDRLAAAALALGQQTKPDGNIPGKTETTSSTKKTVQERLVLDEEAMLRSHHALILPLDDHPLPQSQMEERMKQLPPMTRPPHPTLIYHICGLLFAFAATSRVLNGDLMEVPEQSLAHIFEICPFFAPPATPSSASETTAGTTPFRSPPPSAPEVDDFETTLAVLQQFSLNSKLWKGDTLRQEMLSLLLRDLTLLLARPARCLRSVRELENIFDRCLKDLVTDGIKRRKMFSKSTLTRLLKKLEFYESYLLSKEWLLKTDRLDQVRTEVVMTGIRVRQEMKGWALELEQVSRVPPVRPSTATATGATGDRATKVLIEELPE